MIDHDENFAEVYNIYNNIRIIAQEGLFLHNGYFDKPLEISLKEFFIEFTSYKGSILDELDDEQSRATVEHNSNTITRNKSYQKRLEQNITHGFEIKKTLIPEILMHYSIQREKIYPNPKTICLEIFEQAKISL